MQGSLEAGETVVIRAATGVFLAQAAYSPRSQIVGRVWSWDEEERIDGAFLHARLEGALARRRRLVESGVTDALRLVHGESDGLPGLIVDRYARTLVVQILAVGAERWRDEIVGALASLTGITQIYERSDADVRQLEGLATRVGWLREKGEARVVIREHGLQFVVDIARGHKTGFYLDQRKSRRHVGTLAGGRDVLDCFCYTGGFSVSALAGGARAVTLIDSSQEALGLAEENIALNGLDRTRVTFMEADVFKALRGLRDRGHQFDLVILDPPKFAPTAALAQKAARGYKDINLLALKLLRPGGLLATFSCSGGISAQFFQQIVAGAALDAGVEGQVVGYMHQGEDHPVALNFPEGEYLKGLLIRN